MALLQTLLQGGLKSSLRAERAGLPGLAVHLSRARPAAQLPPPQSPTPALPFRVRETTKESAVNIT